MRQTRRWLVTGGAGFVGSHLCDALIARGDAVVVLDDLSTGRLENLDALTSHPGVRFVQGSVADGDTVDGLMAEVDACVHLASAVGVQLVVSNPLESLLNNVRGADVVLTAATRHGRPLLFTSTSEVYGKNSTGALREGSDRILGDTFKARWGYAIAKSFGESLAHSLYRERGARITVVRLFNTVGPRQRGAYGMVLPRFVAQALAGDDVTVYGSGAQTRCFTHVADTVRALTLLIDRDDAYGRVFNVGSSVETTILGLAQRVIERAGSGSSVRLVPYEEAYDEGFEELGRRKPDTSRLQGLTGWQPERTLGDAIDDVILYHRAELERKTRSLAA